MIWPDLPLAERNRIAAAACDNAGRTLIENYSTGDLDCADERCAHHTAPDLPL